MHNSGCQHQKLVEELERTKPNLLIGNGINVYAFGSSRWNEIIQKLAREFHLDVPESLVGSWYNPEIFDLIEVSAGVSKYRSVVRRFAELVDVLDDSLTPVHTNVMKFALANNCQLLTTNFDGTFRANSPERLKLREIRMPSGKKYFSRWGSSYGSANSEGFRLHHIHGEISKINSIRTSMSHYVSGISWIKSNVVTGPSRLYKALNASCGYCGNCAKCEWSGRGTWLEPFLLGDLVVLGLALSRQEYFLRYLLMQRHKVQSFKPGLKRSLVIAQPSRDLGVESVRQDADLLTLMGAEVIEVCDYKCIWENKAFKSKAI